MKRSKRSRKMAFLLISVAVLGGICLFLWASKPIYPAFQTQVDDYVSVKEALSDAESILYPNIDSWNATEYQFFVNLDGRGRFAKPNGYLITGLIDFQGLPCYLYLSCDPVYDSKDIGSVVYKEVPITIASDGKSVFASFQMDDCRYKYCIHNTENQTTSEETAQEFCDLGEIMLMEHVTSFIDQKYTD